MKIARLKNQTYAVASDESTYNIFLYGIVGWDINVQSFMQQVSEIPDTVTDLNFYMNSPGGIVQEGFALMSNIARLNKAYNTTGYIDGIAGSMMSAIAVSFGKTYASPTSEMVIHDPMAQLDIWGTYNKKEIQDLIEDLESVYEALEVDSQIIAYPYAQKTGIDPDKIAELWLDDGKDHFLSPEMMKEFGLIDGVVSDDLLKPAEMETQEDEDWLFAQLKELGIHSDKMAEISPYRGIHEKTIAYFVNQEKNSDYGKQTGSSRSHTKNQSEKPMKFAKIALKLGQDPNAELDDILSAIEAKENKLAKVEKDLNQAQSLIDTYEKTQKDNEATIKELKTDLLKSSVGTVVEEVVSDVTKNAKGMKVNKNVRAELEELAETHLEAKDSGDERMAKNSKQHMELLAKSNLIPIGKNPDLDDETTDRTTVNGEVNLDALKKAQQEGKSKAEKERKRFQTVNS